MPEISQEEFDARLNSQEGSEIIREIVAYLRKAAEEVGPVEWRAHAAPGRGWGITGKRGKRVFCRFNPKRSVPHVCAEILGANDRELKAAGTLHRRKNGRPWVDVKDMHGARLLEPLIVRAYIAAASPSRVVLR